MCTKYNPFFGFFEQVRKYPVTFSNGEVVHYPAIRFLDLVQEGQFSSTALPSIAVQVAKHYLSLSIELLYEDVRLQTAPSLPSRKSCLWASDSVEEAQQWASKLGGNGHILRLFVQGVYRRADSELLLSDSEPLSESYHRAERDWKGGQSENPRWETLVAGKVTLLEEIEADTAP